jgi:hypothetical protein
VIGQTPQQQHMYNPSGSYSNQIVNQGNSKYASNNSSNYPQTSHYLPPANVPMNEKSDYHPAPQGQQPNYGGNQYNQNQNNNNYGQYENNPQVQQPQVLQTTIPGSNQPHHNGAPMQPQREPYDVPSYSTTRQPSTGAPPAYNGQPSNLPPAFQSNNSQSSAYPPNASYSAQLQFAHPPPSGGNAQ